MPDVSFEEEDEPEVGDDFDEASGQVVRLVDQVIITAFRKNASDIHVEPKLSLPMQQRYVSESTGSVRTT